MYLDTSVLAKLYFNEPESNSVQESLRNEPNLQTSELTYAEFLSVVSRKVREASVSVKVAREIILTFEKHLNDGVVKTFPVSEREICRAGNLIFKSHAVIALQTLDAIHLATCMEHRIFPLFTHDALMIRAAETLKIPVKRIGNGSHA